MEEKAEKFDPSSLVFLVDTREQTPWDLEALGHKVKRIGLKTGDYSIEGCQDGGLCVERKSLDDFISVCGLGRDRFEREIARMQKFQARAVVVEASWDFIESGFYRSKMHPNSVTGSAIRWMEQRIPIFFAKHPHAAAQWAVRFMTLHAKGKWEKERGKDKT